jgi:hypothetical protein
LDKLRDGDPGAMESAAKRKAASASVGDYDGRPAKRQKVPVRATPQVVRAAAVVAAEMRGVLAGMRESRGGSGLQLH